MGPSGDHGYHLITRVTLRDVVVMGWYPNGSLIPSLVVSLVVGD